MPTSVNIAKYPPGMLDILESVCETNFPADIAYRDAREAKAERLRFYGLVRALCHNKHSLAERAIRLQFAITGPSKNVLKIDFPAGTTQDDFYAAIAAKLDSQRN